MSRTGSPLSRFTDQGSADGFTLIELLVVLAIVALIALIVPPLTGHASDDAKIKAAARTLAADFRWLRQQAVTQRRETSADIQVLANKYARSVDNFTRTLPPNAKIVFKPAFPSQSLADARIRFFPDGTSTGGQIDLASSVRTYQVSVSWPFGHVRYRE
ncbi:MAG: GspH/FimT family pseudopilin [Alphaproteobacteria bacterium]|nr:GspH/FimT family pseudopilin [Alphaproteobacteria bacterium]